MHDIILHPEFETIHALYLETNWIPDREVYTSRRFFSTLDRFAYIVPLVRHLQVTYTREEVVEQLSWVRFPNLEEIVFYRGTRDPATERSFAAMSEIIGIPSIRRVGLLFPLFGGVQDVARLFQHKHHLDSLFCHRMEGAAQTMSIPNRPTVKQLRIGEHFRNGLIEPFDFSVLEDLELDVSFLAAWTQYSWKIR